MVLFSELKIFILIDFINIQKIKSNKLNVLLLFLFYTFLLVNAKPNKVRAGRAIACYTFPLVGLITYFSIKDEYPEKAKNYGIISILGTATYALKVAYNKIKKSLSETIKNIL